MRDTKKEKKEYWVDFFAAIFRLIFAVIGGFIFCGILYLIICITPLWVIGAICVVACLYFYADNVATDKGAQRLEIDTEIERYQNMIQTDECNIQKIKAIIEDTKPDEDMRVELLNEIKYLEANITNSKNSIQNLIIKRSIV